MASQYTGKTFRTVGCALMFGVFLKPGIAGASGNIEEAQFKVTGLEHSVKSAQDRYEECVTLALPDEPGNNGHCDSQKSVLDTASAELAKAQSDLEQLQAAENAKVSEGKPNGGSSNSGSPKITDTSQAGQVGGPFDGYREDNNFKLKDDGDRCARSSVANKEWGCDDTHSTIQTSQVMHQVGQVGGAAAVSMAGVGAANQAQNSGTQSGAFNAGSTVANRASQISQGQGLMNLFSAFRNDQNRRKHKGAGKTLQDLGNVQVNVDRTSGLASAGAPGSGGVSDPAAAKDGARKQQQSAAAAVTPQQTQGSSKGSTGAVDAAERAIQNFRLNEAGTWTDVAKKDPTTGQNTGLFNDPSAKHKEKHVTDLLGRIGREGVEEQKAAEKAANGEMLSQLISGLGSLANAFAQKQAANQMDTSAKELKQFEGREGAVAMPLLAPGNAAVPPQFNGMAAPVLGGVEPTPGPEQTSALAPENDRNDDEKPLPLGVEPKGFAGLPTPGPQLFNAPGSPDSGSGGGIAGAGIAGGGGENPGDAGQAGALPREADPRYAGSGSGGHSRGGGGGGGGGSDGPDLSGMIEKLIGAGAEQQAAEKPNLEEFGRDPASEAPYSFLDKSVNIFQRVHQAYQQKAKAGRVALF